MNSNEMTSGQANASEAVKSLHRAAVQGLADARNSLAIHYAAGDGVSEDKVHAFIWFSAAAAQGNPDAIPNKDRVQLAKDDDIYKLIVAAAAGDAEAQRDLAVRLHGGDGIHSDEDAARFWIRKAAEGGDAWSQTTYALQLSRTEEPEARERVWWLTRAAEQG